MSADYEKTYKEMKSGYTSSSIYSSYIYGNDGMNYNFSVSGQNELFITTLSAQAGSRKDTCTVTGTYPNKNTFNLRNEYWDSYTSISATLNHYDKNSSLFIVNNRDSDCSNFRFNIRYKIPNGDIKKYFRIEEGILKEIDILNLYGDVLTLNGNLYSDIEKTNIYYNIDGFRNNFSLTNFKTNNSILLLSPRFYGSEYNLLLEGENIVEGYDGERYYEINGIRYNEEGLKLY